MTISVLAAVSAAAGEAELVASLERSSAGLHVARRCVDLADLLAAALAGHGTAALLSADLRDLDRSALGQLLAAGVAPVGVITPGDEDGERRLRQLGIDEVVVASADASEIAAAVVSAVNAHVDPGTSRSPTSTLNDIIAGYDPDVPEDAAPGRVVAVWGPTGAPGRTTVAVNLAAEIALLGRAAMLADVDTYGSSTAQTLGMLDEAPGIAAAARAANGGQLDLPALARIARQIAPRLRVLTGVTRTERWPELRPSSLDAVIGLARGLAQFTVADCGFCLEHDEDRYERAATQRNGATLTTLEAADDIVAVGAADPVGLQRLMHGLSALQERGYSAPVRVVVNRLRASVLGADAEQQVAEALYRYAGLTKIVVVPDDAGAVDSAVAAGQLIAEVAPSSPARLSIRKLAADLIGAPDPGRPKRATRWRARARLSRT